MSELYVYYRITRERQAEALAHLEQTFDSLCHLHPGLQARVLRRPPAAGSQDETWMEVYTHAAGVDALMQAGIESAAGNGPPGRIGARHAECFEPFGLPGPG